LLSFFLYVITTKRVPLKIFGSGGRNGDHASADSELALLYREMIYGDFFKKGKINNPYFNADPFFSGLDISITAILTYTL
jgi:hypothetical protein